MRKLIFFDLDDTLVRTHEKAFEKTKVIAETFGKKIRVELFREHYSRCSFEECVRQWFDNEIDPVEFRKRYDKIRHQFPYEQVGDIAHLFQELSRTYDVGIMTNSTRKGTEFKLSCIQLQTSYLVFVYHAGNSLAAKPFPEQIHHILSLGYTPEATTYVGDSINDLVFANNGEIRFYGVLTGITKREQFIAAGLPEEKILKDVCELSSCYE